MAKIFKKLCDYGCGQLGKYKFKNGKWCCNKYPRQCPKISKKIGDKSLEKELSEKGENRFILGNELSKVENIPEGLVHITIPAQKYAMFTQVGNYDNFMATVQYVFGEWFPNNKKYERVPLAPDFVWYDLRYKPRSDKSEFDWYIPIQEKSSSI